MFRAQQPSIQLPQTDNTGMTEREGVNDSGSGTCYDCAADNGIKENGRPHETNSLTAIELTENFDFVTLTEIFVDNNFYKSGTVYDYVKFVCPPVKLSYHGRCSGGLPLGELIPPGKSRRHNYCGM